MTCYASFSCTALTYSQYETNYEQDKLVKTLGSLLCHVNEEIELIENHLNGNDSTEENRINFTEEESAALWEKATCFFKSSPWDHPYGAFLKAQAEYYNSQDYKNQGFDREALKCLQESSSCLYEVRDQASDHLLGMPDLSNLGQTLLRKSSSSILDNCHLIPKHVKKQMRPYVIPDYHPMKNALDQIFCTTRASQDETTFAQAGFNTISVRPRSHVRVAGHPLLPGYLVKVNLDSELRRKAKKESWEWFVLRCEGAEKIKQIIKDRSIQHFVVARKWIYPLPDQPSPPKSSHYKRHLAVLLVTDMNLQSKKANYAAWKNKIKEEHLDELYTIISYAKGSSYRPDNIWYNKDGKFAFIDTEYPNRGPDYRSIKAYLNDDMRAYWERLVKKGGG